MTIEMLPPVHPDADPFPRSDFPEPPATVDMAGLEPPVKLEPVAENASWRSAWSWTRR